MQRYDDLKNTGHNKVALLIEWKLKGHFTIRSKKAGNNIGIVWWVRVSPRSHPLENHASCIPSLSCNYPYYTSYLQDFLTFTCTCRPMHWQAGVSERAHNDCISTSHPSLHLRTMKAASVRHPIGSMQSKYMRSWTTYCQFFASEVNITVLKPL